MFSLFYKVEQDFCCVHAVFSIRESQVPWVTGWATSDVRSWAVFYISLSLCQSPTSFEKEILEQIALYLWWWMLVFTGVTHSSQFHFPARWLEKQNRRNSHPFCTLWFPGSSQAVHSQAQWAEKVEPSRCAYCMWFQREAQQWWFSLLLGQLPYIPGSMRGPKLSPK